MSEPKHHEIRTIADFLAIPAEKQGACLIDFAAWLEMVGVAKCVQVAGLALKVPDAFEWIDDGKHIATVTLTHEGREIAASAHEFAPPEETP